MALLKRVKASTLMETLVATVFIVIIFMISSMVLNNLLSGKIRQNTDLVEERLNILAYEFKNGKLKAPYYEDFEAWEISISMEERNGISMLLLEAENPKTQKIVMQYVSGLD